MVSAVNKIRGFPYNSYFCANLSADITHTVNKIHIRKIGHTAKKRDKSVAHEPQSKMPRILALGVVTCCGWTKPCWTEKKKTNYYKIKRVPDGKTCDTLDLWHFYTLHLIKIDFWARCIFLQWLGIWPYLNIKCLFLWKFLSQYKPMSVVQMV